MEVSSHEDSAGEFCCAGSIFLMKLLEFVSKAIKLLLTELVSQCRNILPLAFSKLTPLRSVNTEKAAQLCQWRLHHVLFIFTRQVEIRQSYDLLRNISLRVL